MLSSPALKTFALAAILSAGLTSAALARDAVFTVKLTTPVAERTQVIAQNTIWTCEGDTCVAAATHSATVRSCRQFVREAGPVTAYGPENDPLSAEELDRCNGATAPTTQAQN